MELLQELKRFRQNLPVVLMMTGYSDITTEDAAAQGARALFRADWLSGALQPEFRASKWQWPGSVGSSRSKSKWKRLYLFRIPPFESGLSGTRFGTYEIIGTPVGVDKIRGLEHFRPC